MINVGEKTLIMGILNVTPDSFSDGGMYNTIEKAVKHAKQMVKEGADIIDVGGESTRPGSEIVTVEEELQRVVPVVKRLVEELDIPISIDTMKPEVAKACCEVGVDIVNDITGLRDDKMIEIAAQYKKAVVVMHMQGTPKTMQVNPIYKDVVKEVKDYLYLQTKRALQAGVPQVFIDPGIGFGKEVEHNLALIKNLDQFDKYPVLIGISRKSFIEKVTGAHVGQRLAGSLAMETVAVLHGAKILRVHDVKETRQAIEMLDAMGKV